MKKIKINIAISIIYQIVAIVYGFILPRIILVKFGSNVNGLMHSITQFIGVIGFLDMGVGQVVRSALYKPLANHNDAQLSCIMVSGGKFYRKIACVLLGYVAVLFITYPVLIDVGLGWGFTAGMIAILSIGSFVQYYFGIMHEQLIHADQKSYLVYLLQTLCYLFNMALCVCMIRLDFSIHAVKFATAVVFLIKPFFYAWYIRKHYNINWNITYEEEPIKQKRHGVAQHISAVVLDGTDNIVLTFFSTLSNVSVYSVYYMVIGSLNVFYQSAVAGIQSAAGATWAKQDQKEIKQLFSTVEMSLHMVTVFVFCCTGLLIVPFVRVYTNGLTDAEYIQPIFALLLVLAYGIRCLRTPYNIWILAAGHFKQSQKCHIIAAALNLVFSVILVFHLGLIGIALGTLIAMCYQTIWMMIYATKKLIKCNFIRVLKQLLADIVAVLLISVLAFRITLHNISYLGWVVMAFKISLIALICVIVVIFAFYPNDVKSFTKRFLGKFSKK